MDLGEKEHANVARSGPPSEETKSKWLHWGREEGRRALFFNKGSCM